MPEMVIAEITSVLATSVVAAEMVSGIAPSSLPWVPLTVTVGVLAMAATLTVKFNGALSVPPVKVAVNCMPTLVAS